MNICIYFCSLNSYCRKFIQGSLLKIGVSFTLYLSLLQKILNYRTFNINLYIEY